MATMIPRIIRVLSVRKDSSTGALILSVKAEDEHSYEIPIHPNAAACIAVGLLKLAGTAVPAPNGARLIADVVNLTGAIPGIALTGELILDLCLEKGVQLPVKFPSAGLRVLQRALGRLEEEPSRFHSNVSKH